MHQLPQHINTELIPIATFNKDNSTVSEYPLFIICTCITGQLLIKKTDQTA